MSSYRINSTLLHSRLAAIHHIAEAWLLPGGYDDGFYPLLAEMTDQEIVAEMIESDWSFEFSGPDGPEKATQREVEQAVATIRERAMARIESVIDAAGEWAHGGDIAGTAGEWARYGMDPDEIGAWLGAQVWQPWAAVALRDQDMTPEQASLVIVDEVPGCSLGCRTSNGDLSPQDAAARRGKTC